MKHSLKAEPFIIYGIPDLIISDNRPRYSADPFLGFATKYGLSKSQAIGEVELVVRTAKSTLRKDDDIFSALLTYRSSLAHNGLSFAG